MKNIILFNISEPVIFEEKTRLNRTSMVTLELAKQGNSVIWVSSCFSHLSKKYLSSSEKADPQNIRMKFLHSFSYKKNISLTRVFNNIFLGLQSFFFLLIKSKPDIIYCYTPPIEVLFSAALYSKIMSIDLIIDIRDDWPDSFLTHFPGWLLPLESIVLWPWRSMLRFSMNNSKKLMASSRLQAKFGKKYTNDTQKKIEVFYIGDIVQEIPLRKGNSLLTSLLFVGTLSSARPLAQVIKYIGKNDNSMELHIVGDGDLYEEYITLSKDFNNIFLHGRKIGNQLNAFVSQADILIAPYDTEGYGWSLPAKISSYIGFARPILTNIKEETEEILKKYQLGSIVNFNNYDDLTNAIRYWANQDLENYYHRARRLYKDQFDMETISKDISNFIAK